MKDPFAVLARCLGTLCTLISLSTAWGGALLLLAGYNGILEPNLLAQGASPYPLALQRFWPPGPSFDSALVAINCAVAVLGAGLYCRPRSAWLAAGLYGVFVCFKQSVPLLAYGLFEFMQLGLFYVAVANVVRACYEFASRCRFASRRNSRDSDAARPPRSDRTVGLFLRAHIALAYCSSGLCKAVGPQWWTGESLWRAFGRSDSTGQRWLNMSWTGHYPWLLQTVGIATVALELLYPLAFWRRARPFFVGGLMLMHLGTIAFQGLTLFGLTMIALNLFFWLDCQQAEPQTHPESAVAAPEANNFAPSATYVEAHKTQV